MTLDSHQHFWRYNAAEYPWIPVGSPLHGDWLPPDLAPLLKAAGIDGCIAVEARQTIEESRWLLGLADAYPFIRGVVGWVDLRSERVGDQLAELSKHPRFRGVRHVVQDEPDDRFMLGAEFQRGIGELAAFNLTYDILVFPRQLPAAIELVRRFPTQPFALDHIGKPPIKLRDFKTWDGQIRELARANNVVCKVSGMVTEADWKNWRPEDFVPYLDTVVEAFGPERVLYGSDWPACLFAASYARQLEIVTGYIKALPPRAQAGIMGENAAQFYGIE